MREICTSGLTSGEGKRNATKAAPRPSSTLQIEGKKRHVLVDTLGLLLHAVVHPANVQDRDGAILVMATLFGMFPFLQKLFADGGYQGPEFSTALAHAIFRPRNPVRRERHYTSSEHRRSDILAVSSRFASKCWCG